MKKINLQSPSNNKIVCREIGQISVLLGVMLGAFWIRIPAVFAESDPTIVAPVGEVGAAQAPAEDPNNITLDFKEADINTVLRVLSLKSKVNIVAGPEVKGTVTIRLESVPWDKALEVVLRTYDYVFERDGNIIRVTTREKMSQENVITQTYILNYSKAAEIETSVKDMLTERGRIKSAERTNAIVITDIPTNLYRIGEVIKKLDKVTPQAYIDSKVIKTELGQAENLGIDWKTGGANNLGSLTGSSRTTTFPLPTAQTLNEGRVYPKILEQFFPRSGTAGTANPVDAKDFPLVDASKVTGAYTFGTLDFSGFNTVLQMLKSRSNTKVVSNPRIVVLNNQKAEVKVGSQIPLPTFERDKDTGAVVVSGYNYRDVGVILNVTPHINSEEEILVDLKPEVTTQGSNINYGEFQIPTFGITQATTQVLIRSGETIAIGGLMTDNTQLAEARIPYLSDIPLIGKLFRSKRQTAGSTNSKVETLFFVTVTMVDTEGQPTGELAAGKKNKKGTAKTDANKSQDEKVETKNQAEAKNEPVTTGVSSQGGSAITTTTTTTTVAAEPQKKAA